MYEHYISGGGLSKLADRQALIRRRKIQGIQ